MGREVKRVPLDFKWELSSTWIGYLNPYERLRHDCEDCNGSGYSKETKHLSDQWYGYAPFYPEQNQSAPYNENSEALIEFVRRRKYDEDVATTEKRRLASIFNTQWCRHLNQDDVDVLWEKNRLYDFNHLDSAPTAKEVNTWAILNLGHDAINRMICVRAKAEKLGYVINCPSCDGKGDKFDQHDAEYRYLCDNWEPIDPPKGEGWQLWETVSEGSPISPVFSDVEDFKVYLRDLGYTKEGVDRFVKLGSAPSMTLDTATGEIKHDIDTLV